MAFQTVNLGRPKGADDAEKQFTTALHTQMPSEPQGSTISGTIRAISSQNPSRSVSHCR